MSDVKWIKITTDIFDDEKILMIESLPDADTLIVIWFKLLCLAGKQNNSGVFMLNDRIPYTDKMLATIFRRKEATVQFALKTFEDLGMIQVIDGVITLPNWGKHQNLDAIERKTEYMRNYMREYRAKQRMIAGQCAEPTNCKTNGSTNCNANVSQADKDKELDRALDKEIPPYIPPEGGVSDAFNQFWKAYPKKVGKQAAIKAFDRVRKKGISLETLLTAIEKQKHGSRWNRDNGQYIPNPTTWLNQGRWDDEEDEEIGTNSRSGGPQDSGNQKPKREYHVKYDN